MNKTELIKKINIADRQIVFVDKLILELKSEVGPIMTDCEIAELDYLYCLKDDLAAEIIAAQNEIYAKNQEG